jgi:hypothetical protein
MKYVHLILKYFYRTKFYYHYALYPEIVKLETFNLQVTPTLLNISVYIRCMLKLATLHP